MEPLSHLLIYQQGFEELSEKEQEKFITIVASSCNEIWEKVVESNTNHENEGEVETKLDLLVEEHFTGSVAVDPLHVKSMSLSSILPPNMWKDIIQCFRGTPVEKLLLQRVTGLKETLKEYGDAYHERRKQNKQTSEQAHEDEQIVDRSYLELKKEIEALRKENQRLKSERNYAVASTIKSQILAHTQSLSTLKEEEHLPMPKFDVSSDGKERTENRTQKLCRELRKFDMKSSKVEPEEVEQIAVEFAKFFQKFRFMLPAIIHKCKEERENLGLSPYSVFREILMPTDMIEMISSDPRLILEACKKSTIFGSTALRALLTEVPQCVKALFKSQKDSTVFIFKELFSVATAQDEEGGKTKEQLRELAKVYLDLDDKRSSPEVDKRSFYDVTEELLQEEEKVETAEQEQGVTTDYLTVVREKNLLHGRKTILRSLKPEINSPKKLSSPGSKLRIIVKTGKIKSIQVPSFWEGFMKYMKKQKPVRL
jgi:hypothetical protein